MKILYFHFATDFSGGSDRSLFELVSSLSSRYSQAVVLKKGDPYVERYRQIGIKAYTFYYYSPPAKLLSFRSLLFLFFFIPSLIYNVGVIARFRPSIIHVNTLLNVQGGIAAFLTHTKLLWHVREYGSDVKYSVLLWLCYSLSDKVICVSKCVFKNNAANLSNENLASKSRLIYNAVNVSDLSESVITVPEDHFRIIFPARLEPWKGQDIAIKALKILIDRGVRGVGLYLYGSVSESKKEYLEMLKHRVKESAMDGYIYFCGHERDIYSAIKASHLLLQCSVTPEPFGRTVVEAMYLRCGCIASDAGGAEEILTDCTGFTFASGDAHSLAGKISEYMGLDTAKRVAMLDAAEARAKKEFSLSRLSSQFAELVDSVMLS